VEVLLIASTFLTQLITKPIKAYQYYSNTLYIYLYFQKNNNMIVQFHLHLTSTGTSYTTLIVDTFNVRISMFDD